MRNTYNGWANKPTHDVKHMFFDVYTHLGFNVWHGVLGDLRDHADALREYVEQYITENSPNLAVAQLAMNYISDVRWDQIAEALIEEYEEE